MSTYFEQFGHNCNLKSENDKKFDEIVKSKNFFIKFLINWTVVDISWINDTSHLKSYAAIVNERLYHAENFLGTIHPQSKFKSIWEVYIAIVILIGLFYKPFQFMHYFKLSEGDKIGSVPIIFFVNISCIVDIILRFFIGYYDEKIGSVSIAKLLSLCPQFLKGELNFRSSWSVVKLRGII